MLISSTNLPVILMNLNCALQPLHVSVFLSNAVSTVFRHVSYVLGVLNHAHFLWLFQIFCCPVHNQTDPLSVLADDDGEHDFRAYPSTPWAACRDGCPCLKPAVGLSYPVALGSTTGKELEKRIPILFS